MEFLAISGVERGHRVKLSEEELLEYQKSCILEVGRCHSEVAK